jgi:hypothetical protein
MKMLSELEVQQISGGDVEEERRFEEWLRGVQDYQRRLRDYIPATGFPL